MTIEQVRLILVTGATGLQGGAVARQLLAQGWRVRGLTRNAHSKKAAALAASGAEVVQGNMADPATLPHSADTLQALRVWRPGLESLVALAPRQRRAAGHQADAVDLPAGAFGS